MTHTFGQWTVSEALTVDGCAMVVGGEGQGFGLVAIVTVDTDARLIAAAPDMLAALTECRKQINHIIEDGAPTDWRMWRDDLGALIAKATTP